MMIYKSCRLFLVLLIVVSSAIVTNQNESTSAYAEGQSGVANVSSYVDVYYNHTGWTDQNSFTADTGNYQFNYELSNGGASGLFIKNSGFPDASILADALYSFSPAVKVNGVWYKANNVNNLGTSDKMITRQAGKNMWQILLEDIQLADDQGNLLGLTVDQTYYYWNEKFYVVTTWKPNKQISDIQYAELQTYVKPGLFSSYSAVEDTTAGTPAAGDSIPASGLWGAGNLPDSLTLFDSNASSHGAFSYEVINKTGTDSFMAQSGGYASTNDGNIALIQRAYDQDKHDGATAVWEAAHGFSTYTQVFVKSSNNADAGIQDTRNELNPLDSTHFKVTASIPYAGSKSLGYDNTTGTYTVQVYLPDIDYFQTYPDVHPSTRIEFDNTNESRQIHLKSEAALIGNNKYAVGVTGTDVTLTDENMDPLGIPVQVNTKWDDDSGNVNWISNNESYASFDLAAKEQKTIWHRSSIQNWGKNKPQVGNNNLDIKDYLQRGDLWYEMHVGAAEVYCFGPDTLPAPPVYDIRAIYPGGKTGTGNESASGAAFLQVLNNQSWVSTIRSGPGLRFDDYGPNLAQMTMVTQSQADDPQFKVTSTTTLIPSLDGTRVFEKLHYDFLSDMSFTDMKHQIRLFSIADPKATSSVENKADYLDAAGNEVTAAISHSGSDDVDAAPLNAANPWVSLYGGPAASIGYIVKDATGTLGGQNLDMNHLAVTVHSSSGANNPAYLVPNLDAGEVKAGDSIDLLVEVYTTKNGSGPDKVAAESAKWPTHVTVATGTKLADFPARIQASNNEAEFTIDGGADFLPVDVEGFDSYAEPKLEENVNGSWTIVDQSTGIKDYWQTDRDETTGKYSFTYDLPADGSAHTYRVTLQNPTVPSIDLNAQPRLQNHRAFIEGFSLNQQITQAQRDFGRNTVDISVKEGTDVTHLQPQISVSDYAVVSPASGETVDFTKPVVYTVTSEAGEKVNWTVTVHEDEPAVVSANLPNQTGFPTVDAQNHQVKLYMSKDADLSALAPSFRLSNGASIVPASGVVQNFSNGPLTYTVTGSGGIPHDWQVSVEATDPDAQTLPLNEAISNVSGWKEVGSGTIAANADGSLTSSGASAGAMYVNRIFQNEILDFQLNTDYESPGAWPAISIRQKDPSGPLFATANNSGYIVVFKKDTIELQRFSNGQQLYFFNDTPNRYINTGTHRVQFGAVNETDGVRLLLYIDHEKVYDYLDTDANRITEPGYFGITNWDRPLTLSGVEPETDFGSAKNITDIQLAQQTGHTTIDSVHHTVSIEVQAGTDLKSLTPTISVSDGATISPESGTVRDFTDPVHYTVAQSDGSTSDWLVSVTKAVPNLAAGKSYHVSSDNGAYYDADKAFDGDTNTFWAPQGTESQSLTVNFGYKATFNEVTLTEGSDQASLQNYELQYSNDGQTWTDIPGASVTEAKRHDGSLNKSFEFSPITARQIRLQINHAESAIYLREFQVHDLEQPYLVSHPVFTDGSGNPSTALHAGDRVTTSLDIVDNTAEPLPAVMVVALYDGQNHLVDAQMDSASLQAGEVKTFTTTTEMPVDYTSDYRLRVLLWDTSDDMRVIHSAFDYVPAVIPVPPAPITPSVSQDGLLMWLKAVAGVVKDADGYVSQWSDQSGNGTNAVQSHADEEPQWVDNAVSGKPVLQFDGQNDMLAAPIMGPMPNYSVAFVLKPDSLADFNQEIGPGWNKFLFHTTSAGEVYTGTTGINGQRIEPSDGSSAGTLAEGRWDRFVITFSRIDDHSGEAKLYKDGVLIASKPIILSADWDVFNIGLDNSSTIHGDLAELMVYNKALNDQERSQLDAYFDQKYPLTAAN